MLLVQLSDADVVNDFFNLFDVILETVESLSQSIILEVEKAESCIEIHQEGEQLLRPVKIS